MFSMTSSDVSSLKTYRSDKWLDAFSDPLCSIQTFNCCLCLVDLADSGETQLAIATLSPDMNSSSLQVYSGTAKSSEVALPDVACGVVAFYDTSAARPAALAVAAGTCVYVYRGLRPYYKFTLPPSTAPLSPQEIDIWRKASAGESDESAVCSALRSLSTQVGVACLSTCSQHLLACASSDQRSRLFEKFKQQRPQRQSVITCLATLNKNMFEERAVSCLVVATEDCRVLVLDPDTFSVLTTITVASVPSVLTTTGLYDVEYRMIIACRNGRVYTAKRGSEEARFTAQMNAHIVAVERRDKAFIVACTDGHIYSLSNRGKVMWRVAVPGGVTALSTMHLHSRSQQLLVVAVANSCQLLVYCQQQLVDSLRLPEPAAAVCCGRYGREDCVLVAAGIDGGLYARILRRTAQFVALDESQCDAVCSNNNGGPRRLNIPRRTQLFVEMTRRECDDPAAIHRLFQYDLCLLRVRAAREYLRCCLTTNNNNVTAGDGSSTRHNISLSAQLYGLGPVYRMHIRVQNTAATRLVYDMFLCLHAQPTVCWLQRQHFNVAALVPGEQYLYSTLVERLRPPSASTSSSSGSDLSPATPSPPTLLAAKTSAQQDLVCHVLLVKNGRSRPLAACSVALPADV